jgi:peptidoglycan/xylan/chitin deacetylase (PgdA/CDA1 family)
LEKIGGFNRRIKFYGEDTDIAKRVSRAGKVAFIDNLYIMTSARRFIQQGILKTVFIYFINYFSVLLFNHPCFLSDLQFTPKIIYRLNLLTKTVALTFDDGPNSESTEQILDILDECNVKATFFLIGKNVEVNPEIAGKIAKRGHCLGNHSYTHAWFLPYKTKRSIINEIKRAERAIFQATGVSPKLFRPPHGLWTPWLLKAGRQNGYKIIKWDAITTDYFAHTPAEKIAKKIISRESGSIIVLHDGLNLRHGVKRKNTIKVLKIIIKQLKKGGYKFVSLEKS